MMQITQELILLLVGSAFILAGTFGLVEVAIQARQRKRAARLRTTAADMNLSPPLVPAEEDLEMLIDRDSEINPDGRWRQDLIRTLEVGDPVSLVLEDGDIEGVQDIRVVSDAGTIGYIPESNVSMLIDAVAEGKTRSEVAEVSDLGEFSGVWISVSTTPRRSRSQVRSRSRA